MNRREFIRTLFAAGIPLAGLNQQALAGQTSFTRRRLVLVELAGANDGLNTLVPYNNDLYHALRPVIGLSQKDVIALDDSYGLHASLRPLMSLWESGELAWIQGLGYPKPNRSHFTSIALWETAGDGNQSPGREGWMTHAIEHRLARNIHDPHGISLAGDLGVFASDSGRWLSTNSTDEFLRQRPPGPNPERSGREALAIVQSRLQTLDTTLDSLAGKLAGMDKRIRLPAFSGGGFGEQLRQVAIMIAADLDTPVYRVQLKGFDTHNNQIKRHQRLMKTLSAALVDFRRELRQMSEWDNTLVMSYSEFGRRAAENSSQGTDHGTAAPHLLLGGSVRGGLYGDAPDLADLHDGDPLYTMDYRALYHSMLSHGLGAREHGLAGFSDDRLRVLVRNS